MCSSYWLFHNNDLYKLCVCVRAYVRASVRACAHACSCTCACACVCYVWSADTKMSPGTNSNLAVHSYINVISNQHNANMHSWVKTVYVKWQIPWKGIVSLHWVLWAIAPPSSHPSFFLFLYGCSERGTDSIRISNINLHQVHIHQSSSSSMADPRER